MTWLFFTKDRFDVFYLFKLFHNEIMNQFGYFIKIVHSDNALEYMQSAFQEYCVSFGTIRQTTCGVAEHKNHHPLDIARSIMIHMLYASIFGVKHF